MGVLTEVWPIAIPTTPTQVTLVLGGTCSVTAARRASVAVAFLSRALDQDGGLPIGVHGVTWGAAAAAAIGTI